LNILSGDKTTARERVVNMLKVHIQQLKASYLCDGCLFSQLRRQVK